MVTEYSNHIVWLAKTFQTAITQYTFALIIQQMSQMYWEIVEDSNYAKSLK